MSRSSSQNPSTGTTPRPSPAARSLIPQFGHPRALSLFESRTATPTIPSHTLELFLKYIEEREEGIQEGADVFGLLEEWKKTRDSTCTKPRKSDAHEFKLQTLTLLRTGRMQRDGRWVKISKHQVARSVGISTKTLRDWENNADQILKSRKGSRKVWGSGQTVHWPYMEAQLVEKFRIAREKGIAIYRGWSLRHAKQYFDNYIQRR